MVKMNPNPRPSVVLADRSGPVLRAISQIVNLQFDVIRVGRDGLAAIDSVLKLRPDVLVLDLILPDLDGFQVIRRLKNLKSRSRFVVLTELEDPEYIDAAKAAGANAFVFKRKAPEDLLHAIAAVLAERTFVSGEPFQSGK